MYNTDLCSICTRNAICDGTNCQYDTTPIVAPEYDDVFDNDDITNNTEDVMDTLLIEWTPWSKKDMIGIHVTPIVRTYTVDPVVASRREALYTHIELMKSKTKKSKHVYNPRRSEMLRRVDINDYTPDLKIWKCNSEHHMDAYYGLNGIDEVSCIEDMSLTRTRLYNTDLLGIHSGAIKKIYGNSWRKLIKSGGIDPKLFDHTNWFIPDFMGDRARTKTGKHNNVYISAKTGKETKDNSIFYTIVKSRANHRLDKTEFNKRMKDLRIGCAVLRKEYLENKSLINGANYVGYPVYRWDGDQDVPHCPICDSGDVYLDATGNKSIAHETVFSTYNGIVTDYCNGYSKDTINREEYIETVCSDNEPVKLKQYEWKDAFVYEGGKCSRVNGGYNYMPDGSDSVFANVKLDGVVSEDDDGNYILTGDGISENDIVDEGGTQWDIMSEHLTTIKYHRYESDQLDNIRIGTEGNHPTSTVNKLDINGDVINKLDKNGDVIPIDKKCILTGDTVGEEDNCYILELEQTPRTGMWYIGSRDILRSMSTKRADAWKLILERRDGIVNDVRDYAKLNRLGLWTEAMQYEWDRPAVTTDGYYYSRRINGVSHTRNDKVIAL